MAMKDFLENPYVSSAVVRGAQPGGAAVDVFADVKPGGTGTYRSFGATRSAVPGGSMTVIGGNTGAAGAIDTLRTQGVSIADAVNAVTGAAVADRNRVRTSLDPLESEANIAQTRAQTGLLGSQANLTNQQARTVVPESQAKIAGMGAETDLTRTNTQVLRKEGTSALPINLDTLERLLGTRLPSIGGTQLYSLSK